MELPDDMNEEALPKSQIVIFIRHAESRWNRAQSDYGLVSMFWENDHGLSPDGREQAEDLRTRIQEAMSSMQWKPPEEPVPPLHMQFHDGFPSRTFGQGPSKVTQRQWLTSLLKPDIVYSSPFTRAVQTAAIGLKDILPQGKLVLMREAREQKNFGGADSTGVATGTDIPPRVLEEIRGVYESCGCPPGQVKTALREFEAIDIDVSDVQDEWWGGLAGDSESHLYERTSVFLERIRKTRGALEGGGGVTVVVGHSLFIRTIFTESIKRNGLTANVPGQALSYLLPFCAVIGTRFEWYGEKEPRIMEAVPLIGTQWPAPPSSRRTKGGNRVAACVCGRDNIPVEICAIS